MEDLLNHLCLNQPHLTFRQNAATEPVRSITLGIVNRRSEALVFRTQI